MTSFDSRIEDEAKFDVGVGFELPDLTAALPAATVVPQRRQSFETIYYDTRDHRLARWGISLRCRTGETAMRKGWGRWTVKLPAGVGSGTVRRREVVVDAPAGSIPESVSSLIRAYVRSALLAPVANLRSERRRHIVRAGEVDLFEIDDDEVSVIDDGAVVARFRELEVERLDGAGDAAFRAVLLAIEDAGGSPTDGTSKLVRAIGPSLGGEPDVIVAPLDKKSTMGDVAQAAMANATIRLLRHDLGLRLGGDDEDVHQARVATRRLRSDLRTFAAVLDQEATGPLRDELQWLGGVLGANRDADVLLDRLRSHAHRLSPEDERGMNAVIRRLEAQRDEARNAVLEALDTERYLELVETLVHFARRPPLLADGDVRASGALADAVDAQWKKLKKAVDALDDDSDDGALHQVRIRAKRVRYAAEASAPVCGRKARRLAKAVAALQGVLGEVNDAVVAEAWLRQAASRSSGSQAYAAGLLVGIERDERRAARSRWLDAWREAVHERRRWRS